MCVQFSGEFHGGRSWGRAEGVSARWGAGTSAPCTGFHAHPDHVSSGTQGKSSSPSAVDGGRSTCEQDTGDGTRRRTTSRVCTTVTLLASDIIVVLVYFFGLYRCYGPPTQAHREGGVGG